MRSTNLEDLNPIQLEAVKHGPGPILVLAGAGSGKTRILTNRIVNLISENYCRPENILAVTFTNKAANEMRERLSRLVGQIAERIWVSTFHSACLRILRSQARKLNYASGFSIYDDQDSKSLMKSVLKELSIDEKKEGGISLFLNYVDRAKNNFILPGEAKDFAESQFEIRNANVYAHYQSSLMAQNAMDFGDLLVNCVLLFQKFPEILNLYRRQIQYLLVDEFQDTNLVQYMFLKLLSSPKENILVVGDDDQSIYSFRGANIQNILGFERDFPKAKVVTMEQNYRSTKIILEAANSVIKSNPKRKPKELWTDNDDGEKLKIYTGYSEYEEAAFIAERISEYLQKGETLKSVAVFYRTNAQSRAIEEALLASGIPYRIFGSLRFYDRKEIKDILSYLRLIVNTTDNQALIRAINTPPRGIGALTIKKISDEARKSNKSLLAATRTLASKSKQLKAFVDLFTEFESLSHSIPLGDLIHRIIEKTKYVEQMFNEKDEAARARIDNLRELEGLGRHFSRSSNDHFEELKEFLDRISLTSNVDMPSGGTVKEDSDEFVSLMTLHLAKGLEFPVVFLTGLEEGLLPHYRALANAGEEEEERRLCYVGMTRARKKLFLTRAETRGMFSSGEGFGSTGFFRLPSRYLDNIPENCIIIDDHEEDNLEELESIEARSQSASPQNPFFVIGDRITHPAFGGGVVERLSGDVTKSPNDSSVTVKFDDFEEPITLLYKSSRLRRCA